MEYIEPDAERPDLAAEQVLLDGVLLYTHNTTNAFDEGDPRIDGYMSWLRTIHPDAGFLSEAYLWQNASDGHLRRILQQFGDLGYKAVVFDYSEAGRQDRHGGIMFARRDMFKEYQVLELNGRRSLLMTLQTLSGERFNMIGAHANDRHEARATETGELLRVVRTLQPELPVVVLGDLNSDARNSMLKWGFRAAGEVASRIGPLARLATEQEAGLRTSSLGRLASLAIRSCFQMSGDTIQHLLRDDLRLVSANSEHLLTSYVPKNVPAFIRRAQARWPRLNQPYIEADYILASRRDNLHLAKFVRYARLPDDEHRAISAVLCLDQSLRVA